MDENVIHSVAEVRPRHSVWLPVLGVGLLSVGGAVLYENTKTEDLSRQFAAAQRDNNALRARLGDSETELQSALKSLRDELDDTRQATTVDVAKARSAASSHADQIASRIAKIQQEQAAEMTQQIGEVKSAAMETSTKIDGITSDVGTVKTDVASAKSSIEDTRSDLQRARGDMGLMSGLIATNAKEVQMLRDLGDRNIYEFSLNRGSALQKVGDVQVTLKKVDAKHNRYTLELMADDKMVEKKDKSINEPVQFYTPKAHQPYELVVNQVSKDKVVGYLATPKVTIARQ